MMGNKAPMKPKRKISRGGSVYPKGHGKMKFTKKQQKAARKQLNKERYGL